MINLIEARDLRNNPIIINMAHVQEMIRIDNVGTEINPLEMIRIDEVGTKASPMPTYYTKISFIGHETMVLGLPENLRDQWLLANNLPI